jgi:hypothetical protein
MLKTVVHSFLPPGTEHATGAKDYVIYVLFVAMKM